MPGRPKRPCSYPGCPGPAIRKYTATSATDRAVSSTKNITFDISERFHIALNSLLRTVQAAYKAYAQAYARYVR